MLKLDTNLGKACTDVRSGIGPVAVREAPSVPEGPRVKAPRQTLQTLPLCHIVIAPIPTAHRPKTMLVAVSGAEEGEEEEIEFGIEVASSAG